MEKSTIDLSQEKIAQFCRRNHIRKLSVFGSFLREDFEGDSDIDILVEFSPDHIPGLIRLAGMENEWNGRTFDSRRPAFCGCW